MNIQQIQQKLKDRKKGINIRFILSKEEFDFLIRTIIQWNKEGMSFINISKKLDIERASIRRWMVNVGYKIVNTQNRLRIRENLFSSITTEEDAYWLGFIYADGYISDSGALEISLKHADYKHLIKFADFCEFDKTKVVKKAKTNYKNSYRCRIHFATKHLQERFNKLGIVPRKSLILTFPEWLSPNLYKHFIRGYFDGDGSIAISKQKNIIVSIIGTKEFLEKLLKILNLNKKLRKDKRHKGNTYFFNFNKKEAITFLCFIYNKSNIYLDRKHKLYMQHIAPLCRNT